MRAWIMVLNADEKRGWTLEVGHGEEQKLHKKAQEAMVFPRVKNSLKVEIAISERKDTKSSFSVGKWKRMSGRQKDTS